jgi:hypothetical protein
MPKPQTLSRALLSFALLFAFAVAASAQNMNETGSYFFAERNETVIVEAGRGGSGTLADPGLQLRLSNGTVALRKVGSHRYRFVWHGDADFITFRADSENPGEVEMFLETPQGSYVLKRIRPAGAETIGKHAVKADAQNGGASAANIEGETGDYVLEGQGTLTVGARDGRLTLTSAERMLTFAAQHTYTLENAGGRRYKISYKFGEMAIDSSPRYVTFRPDQHDPEETELFMETPRGNYVLKRVRPTANVATGNHAGKVAAKDTDPPQIIITSPQLDRGLKIGTQSSRVTVSGRATDESGVNEVLVQDSPARLDERGNFSADVLLKVGENDITVTAVDIHGNRASKDFTLRRDSQSAAAAPAAENAATSAVEGVAPSASSGRYYALVIGINDYQSLPRLKTAESDAQAVASVLRERLGFDVSLLLNATRRQVVAALSAYRRGLDADASLLVYYAGHGYNDRDADKAYWLPADATPDDVSNWIIADEITTGIRVIPARHVLVVSDSCYSGMLTRGLGVAPSHPAERERFLQKMSEGHSRTLMASGGDEPVADGGGGGHSVFAAALLRGLREMDKPRFTASELFAAYVIEPVAGRSNQTPVYNPLRNSGHESGDFVFVRK